MPSIKALLALPFSKIVRHSVNKWASEPLKTQEKVFKTLIRRAAGTQFGKDHQFETIKTHSDFIQQVPVRDYEDLKPYVDRMVAGEAD
jgi:hypothetical protein